MITPIELEATLGAMNESAQDLANALADAVRAVSSAGRREKYLGFITLVAVRLQGRLDTCPGRARARPCADARDPNPQGHERALRSRPGHRHRRTGRRGGRVTDRLLRIVRASRREFSPERNVTPGLRTSKRHDDGKWLPPVWRLDGRPLLDCRLGLGQRGQHLSTHFIELNDSDKPTLVPVRLWKRGHRRPRARRAG